MTKEEAYERLELPVGTDLHIVRQKFQQMHNSFQVQIDGAFREDMRQMLQARLGELEEAFKLLNGGEGADDSSYLPRTEKTFEQNRTVEAKTQAAQQQSPPPSPPRQEESQQAYKEIKEEYPPKSKQIWRHIGLFLAVVLFLMTAATAVFFEKPKNDLVFHILAVVVSLGILFWLAWKAASKLPIKNTWITLTVATLFAFFGFLTDFVNKRQSKGVSEIVSTTPQKLLFTNLTDILDSEEMEILNQKLISLYDRTGNRVSIIIMDYPLTDDADESIDFEAFAIEKANQPLAIDGNVNVAIVVSPNIRSIRIFTDSAAQQIISDAQCHEIIEIQMRPEFRRADYYQGLADAVAEITKKLNQG